MSISGQEPIRIGLPNDPANSDSLFTAFNSIQNNFTTVFNTASNINAISAGNGIQVTTTGNTPTITNTGVTKLVAGDNVTITTLGGSPGSNGALVISSTGTGGNGGGSVTSVGVVSTTLTVADTPVIGAGNISVNLPTLSNVAGTYRNPNVTVDQTGRVVGIANGAIAGTVTSVAVQTGNGLSVSGSPITSSGTITINNTGVTSIVAGPGIAINQSNGAVTVTNTGGGGGGAGTVTRVGVLSNTLSVSGSPIITSGNIIIDLPSNISVNNIDSNSANISTIVSNNSITVAKIDTLPGITLDTYSNNSNISRFVGRKARGTPTLPQSIISGDKLTAIQSKGYSPFNIFQYGGGIEFISTGLPANSSSHMPSQVNIFSTDSANIQHSFILYSSGNVSIPGSVRSSVFANTAGVTTKFQTRARGNKDNIIPIQVGDIIFRDNSYGYTGNGTTEISGITGYSLSTSSYAIAVALPSSPGEYIPSDYYITTTSRSNITLSAVFSNTGNFTIPGSFNGQDAVLGGNISVATVVVGNSITTNSLISDVVTSNSVSGVLTTAVQPNITSIGTLSNLTVTGNVVATTFFGNVIGNISGNIQIPGVTNSIVYNDGGSANSSTDFTFNNTVKVMTLNGNMSANNGTFSQTVTANSIVANLFTGTLVTGAQPNITSVGTLASLAVTGNITANGLTSNLFTGTLVTGAQPNITSVGTLASLAVTGNVSAGNVSGTTGAFTDVSGNGSALTALNASNISTGTLSQARLANSTLTVNGSTLTLGGTSTITANAQTLTGTSLNATVVGSSLTSVGTLASLAVTGNITGGNLGISNVIASGNITSNGIELTNSVTLNTTSVIVATVPIIINGVTYKLMLTQ